MRPLDVKSNEEAREKGWHIEIGPGLVAPEAHKKNEIGAPIKGWELVQKAWYEDADERVLHSTKRLHVPGGWVYQMQTSEMVVSTDEDGLNPIRHISGSQSSVFVPLPSRSTGGDVWDLVQQLCNYGYDGEPDAAVAVGQHALALKIREAMRQTSDQRSKVWVIEEVIERAHKPGSRLFVRGQEGESTDLSDAIRGLFPELYKSRKEMGLDEQA